MEAKEAREKINAFIAAIVAVNRDLEKWKNAEEKPTEAEIQREWNYLQELIRGAEADKIDTNPSVCQQAKNCVNLFMKVAPKQVMATT